MDVYRKLPAVLQEIVDRMVHELKYRDVVLSFKYMSHCCVCDHEICTGLDLTGEADSGNELGRLKFKFGLGYVCGEDPQMPCR